ncbi:GAP family protein [Agromyces aerolatus]|uniref:GAP family protein n=1 Tax=Agromyces sp. LY-1074 TaxID=3074080 RepID=UPI00285D627F|nr:MULTISPECIES: GAP family protein [unclassified Agromyces]MDR5699180.1 GAP family protein [Agromyces sp. LY-1074]MDR5705475.1 GAP family protein [Agromyces sp. LY-1358]
MTIELGLTLAALALVDSLSIGTLLIPLFFLVAPGRVRAGRVLLYLGTIAVFYFAVGIALTAGAGVIVEGAAGALETPAARWLQLVIGGALLAGSFFIGRKQPAESPAVRARAAGTRATVSDARVAATSGGETVGRETAGGETVGGGSDDSGATPAGPRRPGRLARWRERAMGDGPPAIVVGLALGAGLIELATMLPYLGAVGMITAAGLPPEVWIGVLAAYCAVMIAPALVLLAGRVLARRLVEPPLRRLAGWLERNSAENTAWIVGIVGFLVARDAATQLGLF